MNKRALTLLADLAEVLQDSHAGYRKAVSRAQDPEVKALLRRLADSRVSMVGTLQTELKRLGAQNPKSGTVRGKLHRLWMVIREALSMSENSELLAECRRGEQYLSDRYHEALRIKDLSRDLRAMLEHQLSRVRNNLADVRDLRTKVRQREGVY